MSQKGKQAMAARRTGRETKPADINTKPADVETAPAGGIPHTLTAEPEPGGAVEPLSEFPAELQNLVDGLNAIAEQGPAMCVELWKPVQLGGGDVAILCQFTEQQFNVLQVRADETGMTLQEMLSDVFMRMADNVWV